MALGARLLLGLALLAALIAVLLQLYHLRKPRLWTLEELSIYNGTDEGLPILLGILGSVFDVTKGRSHYGPGGGYHHFSGRDASRAFVSGNFTGDGLTDSLKGLSSMEVHAPTSNDLVHLTKLSVELDGQREIVRELLELRSLGLRLLTSVIICAIEMVNSIVDWRKFYFERYTFNGKIVGRYYDSQGNPTKYLRGVEIKAKRGAQLLEKQKSEEAKIPSCNSKWSQQDGGEVWCDTGYPRLVRRPGDIALTGQVSQRCACFLEDELGRPGLVVYQGCDHLSTSCKVK